MTLSNLYAAGVHDTRYAAVAVSTILTYDHLLTLDREIEFIWKARWSTVKILFFLNRYYFLFFTIINNYALFKTILTDSVRLRWFHWQTFTGLAACMIAEVILQMRLYALYLLDKKVLAFMATCFIASSTCAAIILGRALTKMTAISEPIPGIYICISTNTTSLYSLWIPILVFECLLCVLALARGLRVVYSEQNYFSVGRDLINLLIRDSVLYFLIIFATYLTNLVVWATESGDATEIPMGFTIVMSSVVSSRIILNARCATQKLATLPPNAEDIIPATNAQLQPRPVPRRLAVGFNTSESALLRDNIEMRVVRTRIGD